MKIADIKFEKKRLQLKEPFVIALGVIEYCESMIVKIVTDEGIVGYGEAAPFAPVTGEYIDGVAIALNAFKNALIGENPMAIDRIHTVMDKITVGNTSAKAAIDIALYDIKGKALNMPLYMVLGGHSDKLVTDCTLGIKAPEEMAKSAMELVKQGYTILKVKVGIDPHVDINIIKTLREAVGDKIHLRADANQGWNVSTAIEVLREFEKYGVDECEQPLPYWDIEGLKRVRDNSRIKIMADESLHSPKDAVRLIRAQAVDMFNIKLMKCGGLYKALQINSIGEAAGVNCMVGCMAETELAISAGASLIAAQHNITDGDMDSYLDFNCNDIKGSFTVVKGVMTLSDRPGLGVAVSF